MSDKYIGLNVSCWVTFVSKGENIMVYVFDRAAPTTPLYAFILNVAASEKIRQLTDAEWSIPGMNVKELDKFMQTGEAPTWVGKL